MKLRTFDRHMRRLLFLRLICSFPYIIPLIIHVADGVAGGGGGGGDLWPMDRPDGMPSIQSLEVMCGKDHMDVHLSFSQPFEGIVSSKGQHGDPRCIYVHPSSGRTYFSFRIAYARCGTKPDLHGQFYENTVVVQYDKDLLEVWDEAKRLRCEWFNDYEKTASKPPMVIADLDVIQLDFRGDNVDCWMEIQHGKGPWAPPVSGIVPLGSTLTLVVAINDYRGEFDMRVKSCVASDGGGHVIQLSDEFGCVLRPKMISRFLKAKGADERASVITYAFFHAFKFPDALSVHIKCKVEICRHGCLDHCQLQPDRGDIDLEISHYMGSPGAASNSEDTRQSASSVIDRQDSDLKHPPSDDYQLQRTGGSGPAETIKEAAKKKVPEKSLLDALYEDILGGSSNTAADSAETEDNDSEDVEPPMSLSSLEDFRQQQQHQAEALRRPAPENVMPPFDGGPVAQQEANVKAESFPQGPRYLEPEMMTVAETMGAPRSLSDDDSPMPVNSNRTAINKTRIQVGPVMLTRRRRAVVVSDRKARSTDVGVSGLYEVISEADLAFSPDSRAEAVTVFQGKIREEVVYGICMPVPGFSVLFIMVAIAAVVSALVAGSLLYRYQMQKEHMVVQMGQHHTAAAAAAAAAGSHALPMGAFVNWVGMHFLRMRPHTQATTTNGHLNSGASATMTVTTNGCELNESLK